MGTMSVRKYSPLIKTNGKKGDFIDLSDVAQYLSLKRLWKMDEKTFFEVIQPHFWYIGQDGLWI